MGGRKRGGEGGGGDVGKRLEEIVEYKMGRKWEVQGGSYVEDLHPG